MSYTIKQISIPVSHGELEAIIMMPPQFNRVMIVAHPHPLHGGTMHNKIVFTLADTGVKENWCTVRFNFRGVGKSTGTYGNLTGEVEDLKTVINYVLKTWQPEKIVLSGFSFGSRVTVKILEEGFLPHGIILCGLPVNFFNLQPLTHRISVPILFVVGDKDKYVTINALKEFVELSTLNDVVSFKVVENADHFLNGKMHLLKQIISDFLHHNFS